MNKFDTHFFEKYIPEWQELKWIIHTHFIKILSQLFLWLSMWALIPSFLYFYSDRIKDLIPFVFLEWLLIFIFVKVIYDIFDWYNDVWIVTDSSVISLERQLLKVNAISVEYDKIEWIEVEQDWILDKVLKKWNLIIHKVWDDSFLLEDAVNPYNWIDLIEELSSEINDNNHYQDERFDMIMDALWWVIENYLDKKSTNQDEINRVNDNFEEELEKIKRKWWIDLR